MDNGELGMYEPTESEAAEPKRIDSSSNPQRAVPYGPVPMSWSISQANSSGGPIVVIGVQTPMGDTVLFLEPKIAKQVGEAIIRFSIASENNLIIPPGS